MRMTFPRGSYVVYCLLGSDTLHSVSYQPTFRRNLLQPPSGYSEQPTRRQIKQDNNLLLPLQILRFSYRCGWASRSSRKWQYVNGLLYPRLRSKQVACSPSRLGKDAWKKAGSDYPVTQATHRHTPKDRNKQHLSLSLSLSRLFDSILHLHAVTNGAKQLNSSSCFACGCAES